MDEIIAPFSEEFMLVPHAVWSEMRQHVDQSAPEEACGVLGGVGRQALQMIPVTNQLHSAVRYRMDPGEQLLAFDSLDHLGLELLAIFHSHPHGPEQPSRTDIEEAFYPETVYLIWFRRLQEWSCRGYLIQHGLVREVQLKIIPAE